MTIQIYYVEEWRLFSDKYGNVVEVSMTSLLMISTMYGKTIRCMKTNKFSMTCANLN